MKLSNRKISQIGSFEKITLRMSGMRGSVEYEITVQDSAAEVSLYQIRYCRPKEQRIREKRVSVSCGAVLRLLNDCRLLSWDGFHGDHPRGVRDGTVFSLAAVVNDGKIIKADGSQNFPKHFADFRNGIQEMLNSDKS